MEQQPMDSNVKKCSRCRNFKELHEFNRLKSARDGLKPLCRSCQSREFAGYIRPNQAESHMRWARSLKSNPEKINHGTFSGYQYGKCRCDLCKGAYSSSLERKINKLKGE